MTVPKSAPSELGIQMIYSEEASLDNTHAPLSLSARLHDGAPVDGTECLRKRLP